MLQRGYRLFSSRGAQDCPTSAFVLAHKLREALARETQGLVLEGTVEIDGAYVGGHIRPANARTDRVDRRLKAHRLNARRSVVALRQRGARTLTDVFQSEAEAVQFAKSRVAEGATVVADETPHWDQLADTFDLERVNHSDAYSFLDGIHVNGAEGYFARLRRMIRGQHHRVGAGRLGCYAAHAAWLEDHRRQSNGALISQAICNGLSAPVSRLWKGYWQRAA
jgi:ISXO2-like transposase domain